MTRTRPVQQDSKELSEEVGCNCVEAIDPRYGQGVPLSVSKLSVVPDYLSM